MSKVFALLVVLCFGSSTVSAADLRKAARKAAAQAASEQTAVKTQVLHPWLGVRKATRSDAERKLQEARAQEGRSTASKVLIAVGGSLVAAGVLAMAAGGTSGEIGDSGLGIDWRTTGALWTGGGGALLVWGLLKQ